MACPICDKDSVPAYRPFGSRRCADVDLGRWLKGSYAIPTDEPADPGEPASPPSADETRH